MGLLNSLNSEEMNKYGTYRAKKKEKLRELTSTPFDFSNQKHTTALKEYLNNFELSVNKMYLYQAMSSGLSVYFGSWLVGTFLPIPEFIKTLLATGLYLGASGYILKNFSMTDFDDQLSEMKEIYNWTLKGGQDHYNSSIDNKTTLADPNIQLMIKLMAPLCNLDFMMVWPKETKPEEPKSTISNMFSYGYSALSSTASFIRSPSSFFPSPQQGIDQNRLRDLKISVETRSFDVGIFDGFTQAMRYFTTNPDFHALLTSKVHEPIEYVKNMIPSAINSVASARNH